MKSLKTDFVQFSKTITKHLIMEKGLGTDYAVLNFEIILIFPHFLNYLIS